MSSCHAYQIAIGYARPATPYTAGLTLIRPCRL